MWDHFELVDITVPENLEIIFLSNGNPEIQYKLNSLYILDLICLNPKKICNNNILDVIIWIFMHSFIAF